MRKTWITLYRTWISFHKNHRSLRKRFRQGGRREVDAGLGDMQADVEEYWLEFEAEEARAGTRHDRLAAALDELVDVVAARGGGDGRMRVLDALRQRRHVAAHATQARP